MTGQNVIKTFMATLDSTTLKGTAALNAAIKSCSDFKTIKAAINKMISDRNNSASGNEFLQYYCGINLYNDDTGAITGLDAGGSTSKNAEDIVPESGSLNTKFTDNSFTVNNLTFTLADKFSNLTTSQKYIWQALYTWWAKNSLDLVVESYGDNYSFDNATCNEVTVDFVDDEDEGLAWITPTTDSKGITTDLELSINMHYYNDFETTDVNGTASATGAVYLDRTLAHEFTHAAMMANVNYFTQLPLFIKEGIAELTHGIDDMRRARIRALASTPESLQSSLSLSVLNSSSANYYAAGYIFMRYLAKQLGDDYNIFTKKADNFTNYVNNTVLSALAGNDTVINCAENVTVYGGSGNDYLVSQITSIAPTISGGAGNDTVMSFVEKSSLSGGSGNDYIYSGYGYINGTVASGSSGDLNTITAGSGNDTIYLASGSTNNLIQYSSGNDIIYGFNSDDTLSISKSYSTVQSDSNLLVAVGDDTITLANTSSANITRKLSNRTSNIIISTCGNDSVKNYADNVTINTGMGNDTIRLYSENTLINYTGGDDVIFGFNSDDTIMIPPGTSTMTSSGSNIIMQFDSGSITFSY